MEKQRRVRLSKAEKERKEIRKQLTTIDLSTLNGDIKKAAEYLLSLEATYTSPMFDKIELGESESYDYGSCCAHYELEVVGVRLENDHEYRTRIEKLKQQKKMQIDRERAAYERLKKQFGD